MSKLRYPVPENENERLARLNSYKILDTPAEDAFDRATRVASQIMGVPIALVSLVDKDRQWFKSKVGLDADETPREVAFCAHAIMDTKPLVVPDATKDKRFAANPLVTENPAIRFYAGAPLITSDGYSLGTLCAIDTKPQEPTEEQLSALTDLAQMVIDELDLRLAGRNALEDLAERKRLDEMKSAFVADVNHELRTPLTSIIGSLGLITGGVLGDIPEQPREMLEIADRNAKQLLALINDLLDMAKLESGGLEYSFETVDLVSLVTSAVENTRSYAVDKNLTIETKSPFEHLTIQGDERRLNQVMNNLLSNAIKFSPHGGVISVNIGQEKGFYRVGVADNGPGIPESEQKKIFEKFVQATPSYKLGVKGTGLGLSICKSIIESHGGQIGVDSAEGRGATFYFDVPVQILT